MGKKNKKNKKRKSKTKLQDNKASSQTKHQGQKPKKRPHAQSHSSPSGRGAANIESQTDRNPPKDILYLPSDEEVSPKRQKRYVENEQEGKATAGCSAETPISFGNNPHYALTSGWHQGKTAEPPMQVLHL